ncbi:MAG: deoxyribose-phosphate aldolase [Bacilli bacterium]
MKLSKYIDHTLLKPDATIKEIDKLVAEAIEYDFASVCVNSYWVSYVASLLKDSNIKVCSVVGFPLGAMDTISKAFEAKQAVLNGAMEIDMVINIGALKSGLFDQVEADIKAVVEAAKPSIVKVIIETCLLNKAEKIKACELSLKAQAAFVKTSTGFSNNGATLEDVALMKEIVQDEMEVKASGGIKNKAMFNAMIEAGATRIGTSSGIALLNEEEVIDKY